MNARGQNMGFHVLQEFICDASPAPGASLAHSMTAGANEGMAQTEELVFDVGEIQAANNDSLSVGDREPTLGALVEQLASAISMSTDPSNTMSKVQQMLIDKVAGLRAKG